MSEIFLVFIVNDKNNKFSIVGSLSEEENEKFSKFVERINHNNGAFLHLIRFENDANLVEQIAKIDSMYKGYSLVNVNNILDGFRFINIE